MKTFILAGAALLLASPVAAQTAGAPASRTGGLSSLLGGGLPDIASASAGNAAGLLGYCVRNKLVGGTDAASVLGKLTGQPGVATSSGYAAGQSGRLQTGSGNALSLDSLKGQVKTRVCDLVLKRAASFL